MLTGIISSIIVAIVCAVYFIRGFKDIHWYMNHELPWQLVHLVRQAHAGEPFQTICDIRVSDEMRVALQAPLTPQQIQAMDEAESGSFRKSVTCYLDRMDRKSGFSGVVNVSIDIESYSGKYDYHVSNVRLGIRLVRIGDPMMGRFAVSSVEVLK